MAGTYDVLVKVISQEGHCSAGHRVGDQWRVGNKTPEGVCAAGFNALFPNLRALRFGGTFPWGTDPDSCLVACPDGKNPVVFELRRLKE